MEDIIEMIQAGDLDEHLDHIGGIIDARRLTIAFHDGDGPPPGNPKLGHGLLRQGQNVRFNSRVRPKYLKGQTAKVMKTSTETTKTVQVRLDDQERAGRFTGIIRSYKNSLDVVE